MKDLQSVILSYLVGRSKAKRGKNTRKRQEKVVFSCTFSELHEGLFLCVVGLGRGWAAGIN